MRTLQKHPYGAIQSLEFLSSLLEQAKATKVKIPLYQVYNLGGDSVKETYYLTENSELFHEANSVWLRDLSDGKHVAISLRSFNVINNTYNDNFLFEDEDLAWDYSIHAEVMKQVPLNEDEWGDWSVQIFEEWYLYFFHENWKNDENGEDSFDNY